MLLLSWGDLWIKKYFIILFPMGLFREKETNKFKWKIIRWRIPTSRSQTSWLFTSVAKDLNSGQLRTNPASGQGRTWNSGPSDRLDYNSGTALTTRPRHVGKLNLQIFFNYYSQTPLYGRPLNTDTSLLWTISSVSRERNSVTFSLNSTHFIWMPS